MAEERKIQIRAKKVSNARVTVPKKTPNDDKDIKGYEYFPELYANILVTGKKKSGKTLLLETILDKCSGKNTSFLFFTSTISIDKTWIDIVKKFEKRGHDVEAYQDLYDDDGKNILDEWMTDIGKPTDAEDAYQQGGAKIQPQISQPVTKKTGGFMTPSGLVSTFSHPIRQEIKEEKEKPIIFEEKQKGSGKSKKKLKYVEHIIVFDDLGEGMREKIISQLMRTNRHYKCKVILSAQSAKDITPAAYKQLDYTILFPKIPDEDIAEIKSKLSLDVSESAFLEMYKRATENPYNFLYIDVRKDSFGQNFDIKYSIED